MNRKSNRKPLQSLLVAAMLAVVLTAPSASSHAADGTPKPISEKRAQEVKDLRFGMFICWSMSTFSGHEWTPGVEDISFFNPTGFEPDQWCQVAKDAGMKYILFLTKHHDGLCLWDTQTTDRKASNTPALKGRDVLAELKKACDKHGIRLALYFSEGDWSWTPANKGIHQSAARPEIKKAQLKELLTQYGPIEYLWFDHAIGDGGLSHADTVAFCKGLQPECLVGFNAGAGAGDIVLRERGQAAQLGDAQGFATSHMKGRQEQEISYRVAEFTYPILEGQSLKGFRGAQWFYSLPENDNVCASAEKIYTDYLSAVKHGNIFSLDVGPDRSGRIRKIDQATLKKVGRYIRGEIKLPTKPVSEGAKATASSTWGSVAGFEAAKAVDGNSDTRWGADEKARSGWLEVELGKEFTIASALLDEAGFDRTRKFEIQAKVGGDWKTVVTGTTLDAKVFAFPQPVKAQVFRVNILEASEVPTIGEFQLFE